MLGPLSTVRRSGCGLALVVLACGGRALEGSQDVSAVGGTGNVSSGGAGTGATANIGGTGGIVTPEPECTGCCMVLTEVLKTTPTEVCSLVDLSLEFTTSNVLVVLDKSTSMAATPVGYTTSKWATVADALKTAMNESGPNTNYGVLLYPYAEPTPATACEVGAGAAAVNVGVGPVADTGPAINALLASAYPMGGTPTAAALRSAFDYYTSGAGASLIGRKYVLLITDGGPNCNPLLTCGPETCTANLDGMGSCGIEIPNCCDPALTAEGGPSPTVLCLDDAEVKAQLDALRQVGIKTFVVGLPGSEPYADYLDAFAVAGGVPAETMSDIGVQYGYFAVSGAYTLQDKLAAIRMSLIRDCAVPLPAAPLEPERLNLVIDCSPMPSAIGGVTIWQYDEVTQSIVILNPQCDRLKNSGVSEIQVVYGCPPFEAN